MKNTEDRSETYDFQDVTISIFDVHTAIDAIVSGSSAYFQERFSFLIDPEKYREQFQARSSLKTRSFEFSGLGNRRTRESRFWSEYVLISPQRPPDPWALQLPFVSRADVDLVLKGVPAGVTADVRCVISLNALGWSTSILVRLQGSLSAKQLTAVLAMFKSRPESTPLVLTGQATTLTDVFRFFESRLLQEIYVPDRPPCPRMHSPRRFVTSLNTYAGPLQAYETMSDEEKAFFRGLLYLREFTAVEERAEQQKTPRRLRRITISMEDGSATNFGLTDWDRGLLLFLQKDARVPQSAKKLRAVHCHAENCRAMLATMESMLAFQHLYLQRRTESSIGEQLQASIEQIFRELPWRYRNQVCQFLFRERLASRPARGIASGPAIAAADGEPSAGSVEDSQADFPRKDVYRYDAFISYRHKEADRQFARQLLKDLESAGYTVAIDERDFLPNATFLKEMERCIKESRFTLAVVSSEYLDSGACEEEAVICKVLDMSERKQRLLPLIIGQVEMPVWLYNIVGINFTNSDPLVPPLERLKKALAVPTARR